MRTVLAVLAATFAFGCELTEAELEADTAGLTSREFPKGWAAFDDDEAFPATDCNFAVNPACNLYAHPNTNCKEKENRDGPGVVQDIKGMHCTTTPLCPNPAGGPGLAADIDVVRICVAGGGGQVTACGTTGPLGCAVCEASAVCY